MRGREKFKKIQPLINILTLLYSILPRTMRIKKFYKKRNCKGNLGILVRYALLKTIALCIGDNVSIHEGVYLLNPQNIEIGNNVSIHPMCYIECRGHLVIGNDVSIAHSVTIMTTNHNYDRTDIPIKDQDISIEKVLIKDNVWVGAKATVLCGITINDGSIVGAGAVVTKDVRSNSIVAGVPAREIKRR